MLSNHDQSELEIEKINSLFADAIQEQEPDLNNIENMLRAGADPDLPFSVMLYHQRLTDKNVDYGSQSGSSDYRPDFGTAKVTNFPLHIVENRDLLHLLLKYDADQNLKPYSGKLHPDLHLLTPIEEAARAKNYAKVRRLASYSPCTIRSSVLNNAIKIIIQHADQTKELKFDDAKRAVNLLMLKAGDRKETLMVVRKAIEEHPANYGFREVYSENVERNKLINLMAYAWIILNQGCADKTKYQQDDKNKNLLPMLPFDMLRKIMFYVAPEKTSKNSPDIYEFITEDSSDVQQMKVSAFRKFYSIMKKGDGSLCPHGFLDEANNQNISDVRFIRNIQKKIHEYPLGSMTEKAWNLACKYFVKSNPALNNDLMREFVKWYISKDNELPFISALTAISILSESSRKNHVDKIVKRIADEYEALSSSSSENENKIIPRYKINRR